MSIALKIYQVKNGHSVLAGEGEIDVRDAIFWLTDNFSPGALANGVGGTVMSMDRSTLIVGHSYYTGHAIPGVIGTDMVKDWNHFEFRYEFIASFVPTRGGLRRGEDFNRIFVLMQSLAKAWVQEYPDELGAALRIPVGTQRPPQVQVNVQHTCRPASEPYYPFVDV